jgi:hypothetical protein
MLCCCSIRPGGTLGRSHRTAQHHPAAAAVEVPRAQRHENVWQFMRDNWLSNCAFATYDDIVVHCCEAWNRLIKQPGRILSIGMHDWARRY